MKNYLRALSLLGLGVLTLTFSNLSFDSFLNNFSSPSRAVSETRAAVATGPLEVHPTNDRWFRSKETGKGVYLTGSSTWNVLISSPGATTDYNYLDFLNFMEARNHNYTRLRTNPDANLAGGATSKYVRSNQCCALDGGNKWDLTQWNQSYFDKMQDIVEDAEAKGIYVGILFYDGWWINQDSPNDEDDEADIRWESHPFNPANNIHTQTAGTTIYNIHKLTAPSYVLTRQKDFITKVMNTVDSYDNVIYEIANEDLNGTMAWQEELAAHVRSLTDKPVGITARTSDNNSELWNSTAEWTSPDHYTADNYRTDPPHDNHGKVILADTDHFWGIGGDAFWVWRSFTRGLNPVFMDPYLRTGGVYGNMADWEDVRYAMGATKTYADRTVDIANMNPDPDACGTSYCLVDPGTNYIVYSHANQNFTLDMEPGNYKYEWYHILDRNLRGTDVVNLAQATSLEFDPPTSRVVLFVEPNGTAPTPTLTPTSGVTATPTSSQTPTGTPANTATPVPTTAVTPTPVPPPPPIGGGSGYEAENALFGDSFKSGTSVLTKNHAGYSGTGFVDLSDYPNGKGGYVDWQVTVPSAGNYVLRFRYGLPGVTRGMHLKVNDQAIGDFGFEATGNAWSNWGNKDINVTLLKGVNTISLIATGAIGGPNIDKLDVISGGTPPPPPPPSGGKTRIEAENQNFGDADEGQTLIAKNVKGYSGTGFIDMSDYPYGAGSYVDWILDIPVGGSYTITFGYALPSGSRPLNLVVNGSLIEKMVFPSTGGSWEDWTTYQRTVTLVSGKNVIRTRATNAIGGPNLDYLEY